MRGLQNGLFKGVCLINGMKWGAFYGYVENVCVSHSPHLLFANFWQPVTAAGSGKSMLRGCYILSCWGLFNI
jgi:hypothetical protein